jgi:hypothetical protein
MKRGLLMIPSFGVPPLLHKASLVAYIFSSVSPLEYRSSRPCSSAAGGCFELSMGGKIQVFLSVKFVQSKCPPLYFVFVFF